MKTKSIISKTTYFNYFWTLAILFFSIQMFQIIWPYTSWELDVDFLQTKEHIVHLTYYRTAFYLHIFSSLIVLASGAFLFSNELLKKQPTLHRQIGKTYVFLLLFISAPTGMVMAIHANGGFLAQLSFLILTPLWWYFTWMGFQTARKKEFKTHKIWMMRSYALTLSAITLRLAQMILNTFWLIDYELQYIMVSWGSWIVNLLIVEWWIYKSNLPSQVKTVVFKPFLTDIKEKIFSLPTLK